MAKRSRKTNQRQQSQPMANTPKTEKAPLTSAPSQPVEEVKPVTVDDLRTSTSQEEFDSKKEALLQQINEKIADFEAAKANADKAVEEAKTALNSLKEEKQKLEAKRDELQKKVDAIQEAYNNAQKTVKSAAEAA